MACPGPYVSSIEPCPATSHLFSATCAEPPNLRTASFLVPTNCDLRIQSRHPLVSVHSSNPSLLATVKSGLHPVLKAERIITRVTAASSWRLMVCDGAAMPIIAACFGLRTLPRSCWEAILITVLVHRKCTNYSMTTGMGRVDAGVPPRWWSQVGQNAIDLYGRGKSLFLGSRDTSETVGGGVLVHSQGRALDSSRRVMTQVVPGLRCSSRRGWAHLPVFIILTRSPDSGTGILNLHLQT